MYNYTELCGIECAVVLLDYKSWQSLNLVYFQAHLMMHWAGLRIIRYDGKVHEYFRHKMLVGTFKGGGNINSIVQGLQ